MDSEISKLIEEAIELELNVSELYLFFFNTFKVDSSFWWKLAIEEKNHAALLKSLDNLTKHLSEFPIPMELDSINDLRDSNQRLHKLMHIYKESPPSREEAFNLAYDLEQSSGEKQFQKIAVDDSDSQVIKIFKQLNQSDVNHANRIRDYMKIHGIQFKSVIETLSS